MAAYVDLVCAEIKATASLGKQPLQTVSFGGGVRMYLFYVIYGMVLAPAALFGASCGVDVLDCWSSPPASQTMLIRSTSLCHMARSTLKHSHFLHFMLHAVGICIFVVSRSGRSHAHNDRPPLKINVNVARPALPLLPDTLPGAP